MAKLFLKRLKMAKNSLSKRQKVSKKLAKTLAGGGIFSFKGLKFIGKTQNSSKTNTQNSSKTQNPSEIRTQNSSKTPHKCF